MMKKLLTGVAVFLFATTLCLSQNPNFVFTMVNTPVAVEVDGDFKDTDKLAFSVDNIPDDNTLWQVQLRMLPSGISSLGDGSRITQMLLDTDPASLDGVVNANYSIATVPGTESNTIKRTYTFSGLFLRSGYAPAIGDNTLYTAVRLRDNTNNINVDFRDSNDPWPGNIDGVSDGTLGLKNFNKTKLAAYYNASKEAIVVDNAVSGKYEIYNLLGQSVKNGEFSREISVSSLKSGLYILASESGTLKFAK